VIGHPARYPCSRRAPPSANRNRWSSIFRAASNKFRRLGLRYTLSVVVISECPIKSLATVIGTSASSASVAKLWRAQYGTTSGGIPARSQTFFHHQMKLV
jgi:hypothetical protein